MNRRRPRKLKRLNLRPKEPRLEPETGDPNPRWASAKALLKRAFPFAALGLAVTMAVAVGLFFLIKSVNTRMKPSKSSQVVAVTKPSTPVAKVNSTPPIATANSPTAKQLDSALLEATPATSPSPTHSQAPVQNAIATTSPSPIASPKNNDRKPRELSETQRKFVELKRREAERKRSRLEAMYRKHEISDEDYKKGQDEYQNAMAKYRNALSASESANE